MKFVTFNPFRTIGFPNIQYVKPELMFEEQEKIAKLIFVYFHKNGRLIPSYME